MPPSAGSVHGDFLPALRREALRAGASASLSVAWRDGIGWRIIGKFADRNATHMNGAPHGISRASL